jgi:hypothetical protein
LSIAADILLFGSLLVKLVNSLILDIQQFNYINREIFLGKSGKINDFGHIAFCPD